MAAGGARAGNDIEFQGGDEALAGYLALPAGGRGAGVVVLQEWWGLVDHIRDVCDRFAREGFVALAPDLYRGDSTGDPGEAGRLMLALEISRVEGDLDACVQTLLNHDGTEGARVGCIGFCMGGQLALHAGTRNPRIGAVVDCYGVHPSVPLDFAGLQAAVLGIFAENDEFVPSATARELEDRIRAAGGRAHCKVYSGAKHAFLNDTRPEVFDAAAAAEAWSDLLPFLRAELAAQPFVRGS